MSEKLLEKIGLNWYRAPQSSEARYAQPLTETPAACFALVSGVK